MATGKKIGIGLNAENIQYIATLEPASVADDASFTCTLPADMIGKGWMPFKATAMVPTNPTAPGTRVWTYGEEVGEAGTPIGIDILTHTEATGITLIANRSGGALVGAVIVVMYIHIPTTAVL